jgi:hypothetical protein
LQHFHGAGARIAANATAFALRREHYILEIIAQWERGGDKPHVRWAQSFSKAIEPLAEKDVYVNFLADEPDERVRASTAKTMNGWLESNASMIRTPSSG